MRWKGRRQSTNVEDRRGPGGPAAIGGGIGCIGLIVVLLVVFMGGDPAPVVDTIQKIEKMQPSSPGRQPGEAPRTDPREDQLAAFAKVVLADTEDVWKKLFREIGREYQEPEMVLFTGQVRSACGFASAAMGPFYCPGDRKVYIDLSFYDQLDRQLGAGGDFAQAYVLAHEVGHHVQNLLGFMQPVHERRRRVSEAQANQDSVRLELQADFLAGVWAHHAQKMKNIMERGDLQEAMNAASRIGDDTLQKRSQGYVVPESFTHGTSAQRMAWFRHGFETGDLSEGNTFDEAHFRRISPD